MSKSNLPKRTQPRTKSGQYGSLPTRTPEAPTSKGKTIASNTIQEESESSLVKAEKNYQVYKNRVQKKGRAQPLSSEEYFNILVGYGVSELIAKKVSQKLSTNPPLLIASNGKLASGKDTITKALILKLSGDNHSHVSLGTAMKEETQRALATILSSDDKKEATRALLNYNISPEQADKVVELAYDEVKANPAVTTYERTPWIRALLQYWATEIRRAQDKNYWTNKTIENVAGLIAEGKDVILTDIRVADEVERFQSIGFTVIRLDITPEKQAERLRGRDGLEIDPKAAQHPTEVSLDNYEGFNIRINNNEGSVEEVVGKILDIFEA